MYVGQPFGPVHWNGETCQTMSATFLPSGDEMLISHEVRFKEDLKRANVS